MSVGWHSLTPVLRPLFSRAAGVRMVCHPLSGDGHGHAVTRWLPLAVPRPGCPVPPGHAVPHPLEPLAIEGPRLPSAGSAAQEQQESGSALLEVAPEECVLIVLGSQGIAHPRPSPWPLVACPHGQVFQGTGWAAHSHLGCAAPIPPTLPLGQDVPPALPVGPEVLASGTKPSVRIHRALNKGAPSH